VLGYAAGLLCVNRAGANRHALEGAALGTVAGLFMGFVGVLFMPLVGEAVGEYLARKDERRALNVGFTTWLGIAIGLIAKVVLAFMTIGIFVVALLVWARGGPRCWWAVTPMEMKMLVSVSLPTSAGLTQSTGTKISPPPTGTGTGAMVTSTARKVWPPTWTGSGNDSRPSTMALPGPPNCSHTGLIDRAPEGSRCAMRLTNLRMRSYTLRTSGMRCITLLKVLASTPRSLVCTNRPRAKMPSSTMAKPNR